MADPEVWQRIRDGMLAASPVTAEIQMLRLAWLAASPVARARFLIELTQADNKPAEAIAGGVGAGRIPGALWLEYRVPSNSESFFRSLELLGREPADVGVAC